MILLFLKSCKLLEQNPLRSHSQFLKIKLAYVLLTERYLFYYDRKSSAVKKNYTSQKNKTRK